MADEWKARADRPLEGPLLARGFESDRSDHLAMHKGFLLHKLRGVAGARAMSKRPRRSMGDMEHVALAIRPPTL
jgi:hypothetical protein